MAFTDLSRFLTGIGFKAPMNEDEARAEWLATTLQAMDANESRARPITPATSSPACKPGTPAAPSTPSSRTGLGSVAPDYTPVDRLGRSWLPTIPARRGAMPAGWQPPTFDTQIGTLITNEDNQSKFDMQYSNTALYMLFDPTTGAPFYVGQSVSPSERIVQHLEEANDPDRFAHPKKLRITELLAAGAVPEMWVFDRLPGTEDAENDPVDVMEQIWIGYFVHQRGQTANVDDIPPAPRGSACSKVGLTVADLDQQFASYATRQDPAQNGCSSPRAPSITASPVPDPNVPPAACWATKPPTGCPTRPPGTGISATWAQPRYAYQPGIDWAETQWGLPGVGSAKRDDLWSAGITTWDQVANPTPAEQAALLKIAENNPNTVAEWMGKAQYTLGVNAGYLPPLYSADKAKAPLPPQQFATGPQGFEYSRPAEGAVYPGRSVIGAPSQPEPDRHQRRAEQCADSTAD